MKKWKKDEKEKEWNEKDENDEIEICKNLSKRRGENHKKWGEEKW